MVGWSGSVVVLGDPGGDCGPLRRLWVCQAPASGHAIGCVAVEELAKGAKEAEGNALATVELKRLAVDSAWRRQGLGRQLIREAEAWCVERGVRRIVLSTWEEATRGASSSPARDFYMALGYKPVLSRPSKGEAGSQRNRYEKVLS